MFKRTFDFVVAAAALIVLSPVFIAAAALIRLTSRGPVLFRQERVGRGFRPFRICKFRTMTADAPRRGGPLTRGTDDPRITRVGRFLRRTKIDELPQLFNVVAGTMSLVGPRPEVPKYVEMFRADYEVLLRVRPGITDPASIKYRNEGELLSAAADPEAEYAATILPDKIRLSKQYLEHASPARDIRVLWQTLVGR